MMFYWTLRTQYQALLKLVGVCFHCYAMLTQPEFATNPNLKGQLESQITEAVAMLDDLAWYTIQRSFVTN